MKSLYTFHVFQENNINLSNQNSKKDTQRNIINIADNTIQKGIGALSREEIQFLDKKNRMEN